MVGKVEAPEKANMMEPKAVKKIFMNPEKFRSYFIYTRVFVRN
jgi:hypothetical protein